MKTTLLSILFFTTLMVRGQKTEVVTKYENGKIQQIGYINSKNEKDSLWLMYNEFGNLIGKAFFKNGKKDSLWTTFDNSGSKLFEVLYYDGKKISGKQWENGSLVSTKNY